MLAFELYRDRIPMSFLSQKAWPRLGLLGWLSLWMVMLPLFHVHPAVAHHHGDEDLHVHAAIAHAVFSADVLDQEEDKHHIPLSSAASPNHQGDYGFSIPEPNPREINFSLLPLSPDRKHGKVAGNLIACNRVGSESVNLPRSSNAVLPLVFPSFSLLSSNLAPRAPPVLSI